MRLQAKSLFVSRSEKQVLGGISFEIDQGEVYALLGGNGAGKSTTLLTFLGFLKPSKGQVLVNGVDASTHTESARRSVSYLPESAALYEYLNAYENIRYFLELANVDASQSDIDGALDQVALDHSARTRKLKGYSKGMRQKTAIALAILRDTQILLLDEPTSGLDPVAIDDFHSLVRNLADSGKSVLMVTHDVYGACQVADRIGLLASGQLVGEFSASEGERIDTETVHRAFAEKIDKIERVEA